MSRFDEDNRLQMAVRDLVIGPGLYGPFSAEGRYVFIDKGRLATILQKQFSVDTVFQSAKTGNAVFVEEKIVRWPGREYTAITLETKSCSIPGRESEGWMAYGQADWLNYAMCQEGGDVVCHFINFQKLKEKFWPEAESFPETISEQHNRTVCRVVPLSWIEVNVGHVVVRRIFATREGANAVRAFNGSHYLRAAS